MSQEEEGSNQSLAFEAGEAYKRVLVVVLERQNAHPSEMLPLTALPGKPRTTESPVAVLA